MKAVAKILTALACLAALGMTACSGCEEPGGGGGGVRNFPPTVRMVEIPRGHYTVGVTIPTFVRDVTDVEGDKVALQFRWFVDGKEVAAQTKPFLAPGIATRGHKVKCEVTPVDPAGEGEPMFSNEVTIANTPPVLTEAFLSPLPVTFGTKMLAASPGEATDADGDPITFTYLWFRNRAQLDVPEDADVISIATKPGDAWSVWVIAHDGFDNSNIVSLGGMVDAYEAASMSFILNDSARSGIDASATGFGFIQQTSIAGFDGLARSGPVMQSYRHRFESSFEE